MAARRSRIIVRIFDLVSCFFPRRAQAVFWTFPTRQRNQRALPAVACRVKETLA